MQGELFKKGRRGNVALERVEKAKNAMESDDLSEKVRMAWASELEGAAAGSVTWHDSGGNSVQMMSFMLELERMIGRSVPLRLLSLEMTPDSFARDLAAAYRSERIITDRRDENFPVVFLIGNDHPGLARFRADLEGSIRFVMIELPSWPDIINTSHERMVGDTLRKIREFGNINSYRLVGASFGGFIAWEAALRLLEAGCCIEFFGLFDTRDPNLIATFELPPRGAVGWLRDLFLRPKNTVSDAACELVERGPLVLVDLMFRATRLFPTRKALDLNERFLQAFKRRFLKDFALRPLEIPAVLFRSEEFILESPDYGWRARCPQLSIVSVGGGHTLVDEEGCRKVLCQKVIASIAEAALRHQFKDVSEQSNRYYAARQQNFPKQQEPHNSNQRATHRSGIANVVEATLVPRD